VSQARELMGERCRLEKIGRVRGRGGVRWRGMWDSRWGVGRPGQKETYGYPRVQYYEYGAAGSSFKLAQYSNTFPA
jgi:hypothetical protein